MGPVPDTIETALRASISPGAFGELSVALGGIGDYIVTEASGLAVMDATGTAAAPEASGGLFGGNFLTIAMVVLLAVLVFFMWRSSRKRKNAAQELQSTMVPGVEVMTSFGLFGTLVSVDDVASTAELEVSPGNIVKVHRQTLVKVVEPTTGDQDRSPSGYPQAFKGVHRRL